MCLALRPEFQFRLRSASETKSPLAATSVTDPSKERFESSTKRLRPCTIQRPETRPPEHRMLVAGPNSASMRTPVLRGSRRYKLFVPSVYREQPLPLVVMLHGCTQTPDDFATGTRMNILAEE